MPPFDLITILGPTASGKTKVATELAYRVGGEIISGDSRQVYRGMDLGTGKDIEEYTVCDTAIPYHLIDIAEPGEKYNIFQYQHDFLQAFKDITEKGRPAILCGGSGLYIESVLKGYRMTPVPENKELRESLEGKSLEELTEILKRYKTLHNKTDVDSPKRAIRAIEIQEFYQAHPIEQRDFPKINSLNIGIKIDRELRRAAITRRLHERLNSGMLDEIHGLLNSGISPDDLIYYGLEYKYLTLHAIGKMSYDEMFSSLEIAIHQFAKRQMTWFRGMEKRGIHIHWIDATLPMEEKIKQILEIRTSNDEQRSL